MNLHPDFKEGKVTLWLAGENTGGGSFIFILSFFLSFLHIYIYTRIYSLSFFFFVFKLAQRERLLGVVPTLPEYWNCWHSWKRKMVFPRPLPRPNGEQMWSYGGEFAFPLNERKWKRSSRFLSHFFFFYSPFSFFIFNLSIVRIGCNSSMNFSNGKIRGNSLHSYHIFLSPFECLTKEGIDSPFSMANF